MRINLLFIKCKFGYVDTLYLELKKHWFQFCLISYAKELYQECNSLFSIKIGEDASYCSDNFAISIDLFYHNIFYKIWIR